MKNTVKLGTICSLFVFSLAEAPVAQELRVGSVCYALSSNLKADIDRMRALLDKAKAEEKAPPGDLLSAWQRTFGEKGEGVPSLKELRKVRKRADGLNESLRAKGCATIDIDQAMSAAGRP
jgi:hypothetical protein